MKGFTVSQSGATAIEYALIAGFVSIVIVTAVTLVGSDLKGLFQRLVDKM